ncbi:MAG: type II toxin-antitoxin system Phd/YefM family antitoxin [Lachnospiraceae bacterium]|nr:type II toxin-antitoxin system Phd/YefM family antitoxin [Lachnospiraceae bacterium]
MPQIIPIRDLRNTSEISELCHSVDEPIYITKNGYGDMVIMSVETYEKVNERLKMYQSILTSEYQIRDGQVLDAKESLKKIKEEYDL